MNVNVISNPLKTFKVVHNLKRKYETDGQTNTIREFDFSVELFPNYFDLTTGVWNVAISQTIVGNKITKASTIFHISTNLLSHAVKDPYSKVQQASSRYVTLASFLISNLKSNEFQFERFTPIFFQVENACRSSFIVRYNEVVETNINLDLNVELTFLFQRIL